jgi:ATP-dependent DNA helicase RecG
MNIDSPIEIIPGVGPAFAQKMKKRGIVCILDLIKCTPIRYVDFTRISAINSVVTGQHAVISGLISASKSTKSFKRGMNLLTVEITDDSGKIQAIWFNQPFLHSVLRLGRPVRLYGLVAADIHGQKVIKSPEIQMSENSEPEAKYSEKVGVTSGIFKKFVTKVLPLVSEIIDPLPRQIILKHNLLPLSDAYKFVHQPVELADVDIARQRLSLDELWKLILVQKTTKQQTNHTVANSIKINSAMYQKEIQSINFELTNDQKKAIEVIHADISKKHPMRRLLNGDVGSGKTIVAFLTATQVISNHFNALMLAPTTVLAFQHYQNWHKMFPKINHAIITAGQNIFNGEVMSRTKIIEEIGKSAGVFICGTHALLNLSQTIIDASALVIVDEQHRFGVDQRAKLINGNDTKPHMLSMSATPIPRTMALILYGDLDITLIKQMPLGRKPITTKLVSEVGRDVMYRFIDQLIEKKQQCYVICPLIQPTEVEGELGMFEFVEEKKAVLDEYEKLKNTVFAHRKIGLLHGKMKQEEKDSILNAFKEGGIDILISTTVVEVGVDAPDASCIIVENAEYFGLSQLHQLRGRVGRSSNQSYCLLLAKNWNDKVKSRLEMLVNSNDGFALAEKDLSMRGPGEIYGTMQAGIPPFKYASISDGDLLSKASSIANDMMELGPENWPDATKAIIKELEQKIHRE